MFKAYKFRLYPDEEQQLLLEKHFGSCRFVWNHFLDSRNKRYVETGKGMSYKDASVLLHALKEEKEWLNEVNSQSLQQELMHLDSAFHGFFRKVSGYPSFRKKRNGGSFTVPQHFAIKDNHLTIPKFKTPLRLFMHRNIEGEMRSLTISKTPSGKYYAVPSLQCLGFQHCHERRPSCICYAPCEMVVLHHSRNVQVFRYYGVICPEHCI